MLNLPEPRSLGAIAEQVRLKGIRDPRILCALTRVNRERFLPPKQRRYCCEDRALPIGLDQTISQPFVVAVMTLELALTGTERVLEIGTGSGYQTAILAELAAQVYTVERHRLLSLRARGVLDGMGISNVRFRIGDGSLGMPDEAPFDRIIVTAALPRFPDLLFEQLVEGGLLVAPIGDDREQTITIARKVNGAAAIRRVLPCRFVRLIGAAGWVDERQDSGG